MKHTYIAIIAAATRLTRPRWSGEVRRAFKETILPNELAQVLEKLFLRSADSTVGRGLLRPIHDRQLREAAEGLAACAMHKVRTNQTNGAKRLRVHGGGASIDYRKVDFIIDLCQSASSM